MIESTKQWTMKQVINYVEKDPLKNVPKLLNIADKIATSERDKRVIQRVRNISGDTDNNWNKLINRFFTELNPNSRKKIITNYFINSIMVGIPKKNKLQEVHDCNIPWAILIDPTTACNLKCTGCWAAEYDKHDNLSFETIDRIINEGKELGIYMYIYSGGEPLSRKKDIIKLAEKHDDCMFLSFTNGTLVDEFFAKELARVGNFALAISVEGFEEETDMRRGKGTYNKVMNAMTLLKNEGVPFGFSTCYHKYNTDVVGSDEYIDMLIDKGALFGWYFTYIPIGKDAVVDLIATPEQRKYMYHKVREIRETKECFVLDFWNDGEYVNGCIAGGKNYFHINASGDVEPCAFIHYSDTNIHDVSLLEALKSPLFRQYRQNQPFNSNHLKPCPLFDNPEKLRNMVHQTNAVSTQPVDEESVEDLTAKCEDAAKAWTPVAEVLWDKTNR